MITALTTRCRWVRENVWYSNNCLPFLNCTVFGQKITQSGHPGVRLINRHVWSAASNIQEGKTRHNQGHISCGQGTLTEGKALYNWPPH